MVAALWLIGAVVAVRTLVAIRFVEPVDSPRYGVDPNTASWPDLALLPEIGEQTARAIVKYREARLGEERNDGFACVFRRPEDLIPVRGIGPKTVAHLAPHLRFDSCP